MIKFPLRSATLALFAISASAQAALPKLYEEIYAKDEEQRIIQTPIAGIYNSLWYDYRINVTESQKELATDLRKADDLEDRRDAWEEYASELKHERKHYIEEMAERGYRMGTITIEK